MKESAKNIIDEDSIEQEHSAVWKNRVLIYSSFVVTVVLALVMLCAQPSLEHFFVDNSPNSWAGWDEKTALELELVRKQLTAANGQMNSTGPQTISQSDAPSREAEDHLVQRLERNDAIDAFMGVTSLVFALIFASTYTDAQNRLNEIRNSLAQEAGGVHLAMLLVRTLEDTDPSDTYKTRVLLLFASYIEQLAGEIKWQQGSQRKPDRPTPSNVETLYAAIPFLAAIGSDGDGDEMDRVLVQRTVDTLNAACQARQIRVSQERRNISPYVYAFLGQMAMMTYFSSLFLHTGSYALNNAVCIATLLSMATSMMILSDLDKPYNGFVTVDTNIFSAIRNDVSLVLHEDNEREYDEAMATFPNVIQQDSSSQERMEIGHEKDEEEFGHFPPASPQMMAAMLSSPAQKSNNMLTASFRGIDSNYHLRQAVRRMSDGILAYRSDSFKADLLDNGRVESVAAKTSPTPGADGVSSVTLAADCRPGTPLLLPANPALCRPQSRGNVLAVHGASGSTAAKYAVESKVAVEPQSAESEPLAL